MRSASDGPISPRSTPALARISAYFLACRSLGPNTSLAACVGAGTAIPGTENLRSADGQNDHSSVRVDALRLAAQSRRRDGIMHDLPLERVHRRESLGLAGALDLFCG